MNVACQMCQSYLRKNCFGQERREFQIGTALVSKRAGFGWIRRTLIRTHQT